MSKNVRLELQISTFDCDRQTFIEMAHLKSVLTSKSLQRVYGQSKRGSALYLSLIHVETKVYHNNERSFNFLISNVREIMKYMAGKSHAPYPEFLSNIMWRLTLLLRRTLSYGSWVNRDNITALPPGDLSAAHCAAI